MNCMNLEDSYCSKEEAIKSFKSKKLSAEIHFLDSNPYDDMSDERMSLIETTLNNNEIVCALKFDDEERTTYTL